MRLKFLILLCGSFCVFSKGALCAAAGPEDAWLPTDKALKVVRNPVGDPMPEWRQLRCAVENNIAPFNISPVYRTKEDTRWLISNVVSILSNIDNGKISIKDAAALINSKTTFYRKRELRENNTRKLRSGETERITAENFSVGVDERLWIFKDKKAGRAIIYDVVESIVKNLGNYLLSNASKFQRDSDTEKMSNVSGASFESS